MTVNELIEHLDQFQKVYGKDMPVLIENAGMLQEIDGVWVDKYLTVAVLGKEEIP